MIDNESKCFSKGQGIYPRSRASSLSEANRAIAALQAKVEALTKSRNYWKIGSQARTSRLRAKVEKLETALAVCDVPVKRLTAKVEELQKWKDYVMGNNEFYHSQEVSDADT